MKTIVLLAAATGAGFLMVATGAPRLMGFGTGLLAGALLGLVLKGWGL